MFAGRPITEVEQAAGIPVFGNVSIKATTENNTFGETVESVKIRSATFGTENEFSIRLNHNKDTDEKTAYIGGFFFEEGGQQGGKATRILSNLVTKLANAGFEEIDLMAARGEGMVGYWVWPRLGFDGSFHYLQYEKAMDPAPLAVRNATTFSDLMKTKQGRDWWQRNGGSVPLRFHLNQNSISRRVLAAYIQEKRAKERGLSRSTSMTRMSKYSMTFGTGSAEKRKDREVERHAKAMTPTRYFERYADQLVKHAPPGGIEIDGKRYRPGELLPPSARRGRVERYEVRHAPKGGAVVAGHKFSGGQFIPSAIMAKATPEERQALEGGAAKPTGPVHKLLFDPAMIKHLPDTARQPGQRHQGYSELASRGIRAKHLLDNMLDHGHGLDKLLGCEVVNRILSEEEVHELVAKPGCLLMLAPIKGAERSAEKVRTSFGGDWRKLIDVARATIALDSMDDLQNLTKVLGAKFAAHGTREKASHIHLAKKPKDRFANPTDVGYRDMVLNLRMPSGAVVELQLHLKSMVRAKSAGHKHYETMRKIEADVKHHKRRMTKEEKAEYDQAFAASKKLYDEAWAAATSR
jgi:hypothetical protein